jgi:hypothetical protein
MKVLLLLLVLLLSSILPNTSLILPKFQKVISSSIVAVIVGISPLINVQQSLGDDTTTTTTTSSSTISLQEQLQNIAKLQLLDQQKQLEQDELDALNRQIKYSEGKLIATGKIILGPETPTLPLGVSKPSLLSSELADDKATLFILAVGRDGPPLAAKKYAVSDLKFPLVFEILDTDLIFPYTPEAWRQSSNSKDTIAVTALLSPANLLATPNPYTKVGFGLSQPLNIAGLLSRSPAKVVVKDNVDTTLYSPEEIKLLSGVDTELNRIEGKK